MQAFLTMVVEAMTVMPIVPARILVLTFPSPKIIACVGMTMVVNTLYVPVGRYTALPVAIAAVIAAASSATPSPTAPKSLTLTVSRSLERTVRAVDDAEELRYPIKPAPAAATVDTAKSVRSAVSVPEPAETIGNPFASNTKYLFALSVVDGNSMSRLRPSVTGILIDRVNPSSICWI